MFLTLAEANVFGFLAVALIAASALFMLLRGRILKITRNLQLIRVTHIVISTLAGLFLLLHVIYFISYPITNGIILGYASFVIALVVWLTGSAFLEKMRGSLFFHGTLSIVLLSLALMHAATTGINLPPLFSELVLGSTVVVVLTNVVYQSSKIKHK
jgi:hypothetical protein